MSPSSWSFVAMVFRLSSRVISMVVSTGALLKEHMSFASSQPTPARIADVMSTNASHSVKRRRCPFFFSFCRSALLRVERCCVRLLRFADALSVPAGGLIVVVLVAHSSSLLI